MFSHIFVVFGMAISKGARDDEVGNFLPTYRQRIIVVKYLRHDHVLSATAPGLWILFLGRVS